MKLKDIEEKIKTVHSPNTKEERAAFCKYAGKVPDNGTIVDIGTCAGSSAFIFAFASKPSVKVFTMDPNRSEKFFYDWERLGFLEKLTYYQQTSEAFAKDFNGKIDLLFVDGVHSYRGVGNDINWFKKHMVDGGIIMFHDYYLYRNTIGRAINEAEERGDIEKIEIIDSLYKENVRTGLYIARVK